MIKTPIQPDFPQIPEEFHDLLAAGQVYDSSCSPQARVFFIDREGGLYLKSAPKGSLELEGQMNAYFHSLGLGPEVLCCLSREKDWLLTRQLPGEDCLHRAYLEDPKRLCDVLAQSLRMLHSLDHRGCPVPDHTARYIRTARENHRAGRYDTSLFPDNWGYATAEEALAVMDEYEKHLKTDTLLHGDYCLPNILLNNWELSGFIDVGGGGVGDRHVDLFWGAWTLNFNLKTDKYSPRFLDAYGRENFQPEMLRAIAAFEVFL